MRWLVPNKALIHKGLWVVFVAIALLPVLPILPKVLLGQVPLFVYLFSVFFLALGFWGYLLERSLDYRIALGDGELWIQGKDGRIRCVPKQEVLTDGKVLLVHSLWISLGVTRRYVGWVPLYRPKELSELTRGVRRVSSLELIIAGLKAKSLICWVEAGIAVVAIVWLIVGLSLLWSFFRA